MVDFIEMLLGAIYQFVAPEYVDMVTAIAVPVYVGIILIATFWFAGWTVKCIYSALRGSRL